LISRKEREHLRHRTEILEAALDLFSKKGFHNVSMREIAEKSEFAVGTLYNFFSNKEDLYKSIILEKAEEFRLALTEAIETPGTEMEKVRRFVETLIRIFMKNLNYVRFYLGEAWGVSFNLRASLDADIKNLHGEILQKLAKVFKKGTKKKILKRLDPYLLAVAIDSVTSAFLFQYLENPDEYHFDADLIMDLFFQSVYEKRGGANE